MDSATSASGPEHDHAALLARLYAAADSVETTRTLLAEIRQADALTDPRPEARGLVELADLIVRARQLLDCRRAPAVMASPPGHGATRPSWPGPPKIDVRPS